MSKLIHEKETYEILGACSYSDALVSVFSVCSVGNP
jgi:hypothetical protein